VWALAISADEQTIVSGAADSVVTFWKDCTEEVEEEKEAKRVDMVLKSVTISIISMAADEVVTQRSGFP